jgi:hypothetical protein
MMKALKKPGIEKNVHEHNKDYIRQTYSHHTNWRKAEIISSKFRVSTLLTPTQNSASVIRQVKEKKGSQIGKEEVISIFR